MNNSKGFTLIELLAVIVILAVVAVISIPIITGVIDKARTGSYKSSVSNYVDAVEKQIAINELDKSKKDISDGTYTVEELKNNYSLKIKGNSPKDGYINIVNKHVVNGLFNVSNNLVLYSNSQITIKGAYTNKYVDAALDGTDPVIKGDLIPVTIMDDGTVKKADINSMWYNYSMKKWANAVILVDKTKTYSNNEVIPESNIQSYFVWIPRYKYRLFNTNDVSIINEKPETNKAQTIEIVFENKDTKISNGNKVGDYLTHPAFTSFESNGMWVGKFETGYSGATSTASAQITSSDSSKIIIKPNVFSWRNNTVYNMFVSSYNYSRANDSHMMKNTEWGAVAYLSHSKYGIKTEVNINNNSSYKTGYSALPSTNQQIYPGTCGDGNTYNNAYNTEIGYLASTTGNITGVYDMSGGAHEYMASYMNGQLGSSEFTTTTIADYNSKYFDVYSSSGPVNSYEYRILGDATGEMGPFKQYLDGDNNSRWHNSWYADLSNFVYSSNPWFNRGGYYVYGVIAGQFSFNRNKGGADTYIGSRLVLAP